MENMTINLPETVEAFNGSHSSETRSAVLSTPLMEKRFQKKMRVLSFKNGLIKSNH